MGRYLGVDLGASSGRAVLGELRGGSLALEEIHRFGNAPVAAGGTLWWDLLALWGEVEEALRICSRRGVSRLDGIGIDTWGVDFGLLGPDGMLLLNPVCYRDRHTAGCDEAIRARIGDDAFYRITGMPISLVGTLPQLIALERRGAGRVLQEAERLLFMPDLFRYLACGVACSELTIMTSSLLLDINSRQWSREIVEAFGIPARMLPPPVRVGSVAGPLAPELRAATGIDAATVMVTAGHDTLAAAAAVPATGPDAAFISSGTWSVVGVMAREPVTTPEARRMGFANEIAAEGLIVVKNLMGFYLLENLRMRWRQAGELAGYEELVEAASRAAPFGALLDLNDPLFFSLEDAERAMAEYLRATGQGVSPGRGELARAIFEGLALSFREALADLEAVGFTGISRISLVGGGSRNALLSRFVADATGCVVLAGPAEATVTGNIGLQCVASGELRDAGAIRALASAASPLRRYEPASARSDWDRAHARLGELVRLRRGGTSARG